MSNGPDIHELARQQAVLEERMKTMQAEYRTDIARLAEYMATSQSDLREDMAKRDTESAKRETRLLLAIAGMIGLAVAILGLWLS